MTKEEFITIVQRCGYGTKKSAKKYVEKNPKEEYSTNDLIALHEGNMHWQGVNADKGLRYAGFCLRKKMRKSNRWKTVFIHYARFTNAYYPC